MCLGFPFSQVEAADKAKVPSYRLRGLSESGMQAPWVQAPVPRLPTEKRKMREEEDRVAAPAIHIPSRGVNSNSPQTVAVRVVGPGRCSVADTQLEHVMGTRALVRSFVGYCRKLVSNAAQPVEHGVQRLFTQLHSDCRDRRFIPAQAGIFLDLQLEQTGGDGHATDAI